MNTAFIVLACLQALWPQQASGEGNRAAGFRLEVSVGTVPGGPVHGLRAQLRLSRAGDALPQAGQVAKGDFAHLWTPTCAEFFFFFFFQLCALII